MIIFGIYYVKYNIYLFKFHLFLFTFFFFFSMATRKFWVTFVACIKFLLAITGLERASFSPSLCSAAQESILNNSRSALGKRGPLLWRGDGQAHKRELFGRNKAETCQVILCNSRAIAVGPAGRPRSQRCQPAMLQCLMSGPLQSFCKFSSPSWATGN